MNRTLYFYGIAHFAKSIFWYLSATYYAFFLTELLGVPPIVMGYILAVGLIFSAMFDIGIGYVMAGRLGTSIPAARLQMAGAMLCSAGFFLLTWVVYLPSEMRVIGSLLVGIGFRISYSLYDVSQSTLIALIAVRSDTMRSLISMRLLGSGLAIMAVAALAGPIANFQSGDGLWVAQAIALAAGLLAVGSAAILAFAVAGEASAQTPPEARADDLAQASAGRTSTLITILAAMAASSLFGAAFLKLEPYVIRFVLSPNSSGSLFAISAGAGIALAQILWRSTLLKVPFGTAFVLGGTVQGVGILLFNASLGGSEIGTNLAILLFGLGNGYLGSAIWQSYSACVQARRPREMGLLFGIFTAAAKVSLALCGLIIGLVLARYDYAGAERAIITNLITLMPLLGSLCCILAGAALCRLGRQGSPNLTAPGDA